MSDYEYTKSARHLIIQVWETVAVSSAPEGNGCILIQEHRENWTYRIDKDLLGILAEEGPRALSFHHEVVRDRLGLAYHLDDVYPRPKVIAESWPFRTRVIPGYWEYGQLEADRDHLDGAQPIQDRATTMWEKRYGSEAS